MGSGLVIPSYQNGFAPRDGPPAYPELWDGLVGLWQPTLGPTGLKLFDQSGYHRDGTLTNMDPATDWVTSPHGWALDLDGTNDYVDCGEISFPGPVSVLFDWAGSSSSTSIGGMGGYNGTAWMLGPDEGDRVMFYALSGASPAITGLTLGTTRHTAVGTFMPSTYVRVYLDGGTGGFAEDTSGIPVALTPDVSIKLGNRGDGTGDILGQLYRAAIWSRILLPSEIQLLHHDPHAIVRLKQRVLFASAGGAPPAPPYWMWARQQQAQVIGGGVL